MQLPRLLAAALALSAATAAQAATGSGTISFEFTGFEGPFGIADPAVVSDPSQWLLTGLVNGQTPVVNGVTTLDDVGRVYVGGTAGLTGQSVEMVYANVPGAIASLISFTPAAGFTNVTTGQAFKLGTLSFTNGQWSGGSANPLNNYPVNLGFRLSTASSTPDFNQMVTDSITVVTNQVNGLCDTPAQQKDEADFIYLAGSRRLGSMRVFDQLCKPAAETNTGAVELWARFGSLEYVDLRNPTGSAFIVDGVDIGPIGGGVPEPAAWATMIAGFGLAGAALRRRRSRAVPALA